MPRFHSHLLLVFDSPLPDALSQIYTARAHSQRPELSGGFHLVLFPINAGSELFYHQNNIIVKLWNKFKKNSHDIHVNT